MATNPENEPLTSGLLSRLLHARGEEIREAREARGWSQAQLATKVGTSQQTVDRVEKGMVKHTRWLAPLQDALDIPRPREVDTMDVVARQLLDAFKDEGGPDAKLFVYSDDRPVYDLSHEILEARFEKTSREEFLPSIPIYPIYFSDGPVIARRAVKFVEPPGPLERIPGAYGATIFGDEMAPVFKPGDTVFINPYLPPRFMNEVLIFGRPGNPREVMVGTLIEQHPDQWLVDQHNPDHRFQLPRADWPQVHVIVARYINT